MTRILFHPRAWIALCVFFLILSGAAGTASADTFVNNQDGTVTDTRTGLMWSKNALPLADQGDMTWEEAGTRAQSSSLAGYSNWRMPTKQEISAFLPYFDDTVARDMAHTFDNLPANSARYWTSTTINNDESAYLITFAITVEETDHSLSISVERGESAVPVSEVMGTVWLVRNTDHGSPVTRERADFLFSWLENEHPEVLYPLPQVTKEAGGIFFREYPGSGYSLRAMDTSLYVVDPQGTAHNAGSFMYWVGYAKAETLFNWLEKQSALEDTLKPRPQKTQNHEDYFYRYYPEASFYILTYHGELKYIDQSGTLHDAGKVDDWLQNIDD